VQIRISGVGTVHQEAELYGPLPGELQDTPAAEAYAVCMFLRFAGAGPHVYHVDNQWVVDCFAGGRACCTKANHVFADLWLRIWARLDDIGSDAVSVEKVKGHLRLCDLRTVQDGMRRIANNMADSAAKLGAKEHPADASASLRVARTSKMVTVLGRYLGRHAAKFERQGAQPRAAFPKKRPRLALTRALKRSAHSAYQRGGRWRCGRCLRSSATAKGLLGLKCRAGKEHRVWRHGDVLFCSRCGAYSRRKARLLMVACGRRTSAAGKKVLRLLSRGVCPATGRHLPGHAVPHGVEDFDRQLGAANEALPGRWSAWEEETSEEARPPRAAAGLEAQALQPWYAALVDEACLLPRWLDA
jgi:hypothetical protein